MITFDSGSLGVSSGDFLGHWFSCGEQAVNQLGCGRRNFSLTR